MHKPRLTKAGRILAVVLLLLWVLSWFSCTSDSPVKGVVLEKRVYVSSGYMSYTPTKIGDYTYQLPMYIPESVYLQFMVRENQTNAVHIVTVDSTEYANAIVGCYYNQ